MRLQVEDVCAGGRVRDRATVIQKKTGRSVQFEITEQTRASIQAWLPVNEAGCDRISLLRDTSGTDRLPKGVFLPVAGTLRRVDLLKGGCESFGLALAGRR